MEELTLTEEPSEITGSFCSFIDEPNDYSTYLIVGDMGDKLIVKLNTGEQRVALRDEIIIF